ncbi:hypothetical protein PRtIB026_A02900 [Pseudomonas sp. RtIB026]|nr:hypothetical protein PRtIB026_A02900 [Pseudomonas sp. RtIB026]
MQYESLSIILQRSAIAYWWRRIQYRTGRIQYGRCRNWIFPPPGLGFYGVPALENGARRAGAVAALLDKSTSVADGEGVGKSPMMRAFQGGSSFQPSSCARRCSALRDKPIKR